MRETEFTFINLPDAEFEEEKDLEEVEEHDERSSNILRMQRGADDTQIQISTSTLQILK